MQHRAPPRRRPVNLVYHPGILVAGIGLIDQQLDALALACGRPPMACEHSSQPYHDYGKCSERTESLSEFVVATSDATELLEQAEQPLDSISSVVVWEIDCPLIVQSSVVPNSLSYAD